MKLHLGALPCQGFPWLSCSLSSFLTTISWKSCPCEWGQNPADRSSRDRSSPGTASPLLWQSLQQSIIGRFSSQITGEPSHALGKTLLHHPKPNFQVNLGRAKRDKSDVSVEREACGLKYREWSVHQAQQHWQGTQIWHLVAVGCT